MGSSKTARLRRRQSASKRKQKELRKAGQLPQHTRTERRREAATRQADRERRKRTQTYFRRAAAVAVTAEAAAAVVFVLQPHDVTHVDRFDSVPALSAIRLYAIPGDRPDFPHTELAEVSSPDPFIPAAGTASISAGIGPYPSGGYGQPDGWERYHRFGPLTGD